MHEIQGADVSPLEMGPTFASQMSPFKKCHSISCLSALCCGWWPRGKKELVSQVSWLAQKVKRAWPIKASQILPWVTRVASRPPCNYRSLCITAGQAGAPARSSRQQFSPPHAPNLKASLDNLEIKKQLAEPEKRRHFRARINLFIHSFLHSQFANSWPSGCWDSSVLAKGFTGYSGDG